MSIEERIQELLAQAEPLRALNDDDPRKESLAGLVDRINGLREEQAAETMRLEPAAPEWATQAAARLASVLAPSPETGENAAALVQAEAAAKRGPGRPKKVEK